VPGHAGQADIHAIGIDVLIDAPVRVTGEIGNHAAPVRFALKATDRHDRKHLLDRPDVRHRFEHRKVDEVLVDQAFR
jgi:hypothetical protein